MQEISEFINEVDTNRFQSSLSMGPDLSEELAFYSMAQLSESLVFSKDYNKIKRLERKQASKPIFFLSLDEKMHEPSLYKESYLFAEKRPDSKSQGGPKAHICKTTVSNYLAIIVELTCFFIFYVPIVPLKHNMSVPKIIRENFSHYPWSFPDFVSSFNFSIISILINWVIFAIALPLLMCRLVNFSKRVGVSSPTHSFETDKEMMVGEITGNVRKLSRYYKYDPLMFALCKFLVHYYVYMHCGLMTFLYFGNYKMIRAVIALQLGIYNFFLVQMGIFPLISGFIIVICALYSRLKDKSGT